ncbi:hypothetical protein PIB30_090338 [Stylosanthes scabra]|uniref:Uncharacterized protein n=1 Tax=Stylosanthes scabra TaxID=79078 RepID=A0ABU6ZSV7_9FABA|nr:hypothetical protein [Stylosanthes scabra]
MKNGEKKQRDLGSLKRKKTESKRAHPRYHIVRFEPRSQRDSFMLNMTKDQAHKGTWPKRDSIKVTQASSKLTRSHLSHIPNVAQT